MAFSPRENVGLRVRSRIFSSAAVPVQPASGAGTLRNGQARKMGLCAGCGALAQAPFLGQLAAKRCRARARFLGLPVLALPFTPFAASKE